jgi:dimethylglycine dehydrogenase
MQQTARVVVIGGGNMGAGVLYHLAKEGWTDCLLIEKAELTSGATWHAAGLVSRMVAGQALGSLHDYAVEFYKNIEAETGQSVSWHNCGSIRVATTQTHRDWINHIYDSVRARRQSVEFLSPGELKELNPFYEPERNAITQAVFTPDDGHVDPAGTCFAMVKGARNRGARVERQCRVTGVRQFASGEWEVQTEKGNVRCEHIVNAGGYHAKQIGQWSGLDLPITTMQHHYVVTDDVSALDGMDREFPVMRDDHYCGYMRREQRGILIGLYDKQAPKAKWLEGCPWESEHELFEPDWDNITPWLGNFFERCPSLADQGIKRVVNGGITYTPDGAMILGPAPGLRNYWLACGATVGIAWGPGAGRTLAQWMVHGSAQVSTRAFDPRRFGAWADTSYATERAIEDYTMRISIPLPGEQKLTRRDVKLSGAHARTKSLGAVYEEAGGWERPRWYALDELPAEDVVGYRRGRHFDLIKQECMAVRERVGLGDFSSFAKFEVSGADARIFLDRVCANRVTRRVGGTTLTQLLNESGSIEGEATIACLGEDRFYFVTGAPSERRMWDWLTLHHRGDERVDIENKTDEIGILVLAGPKARDVLEQCTVDDLSNAALPWLRCKDIEIEGVKVLAVRLSFTGDLAWELHASNAHLEKLWDCLWKTGLPYDMRAFGSFALNSLRIEKAYRGGHELANDATPLDAGLGRLVKFDKEFIGKSALVRQLQRGRDFNLLLLSVEAGELDPLGGEAVMLDGVPIGSVCSAGYGHAVQKNLVFSYVSADRQVEGKALSVSILGEPYSATLLPSSPLDPDNSRLKA